jgi:hypothetical protein
VSTVSTNGGGQLEKFSNGTWGYASPGWVAHAKRVGNPLPAPTNADQWIKTLLAQLGSKEQATRASALRDIADVADLSSDPGVNASSTMTALNAALKKYHVTATDLGTAATINDGLSSTNPAKQNLAKTLLARTGNSPGVTNALRLINPNLTYPSQQAAWNTGQNAGTGFQHSPTRR